MGFAQGAATPCVFYLQERGLRAYVHGDDFVVIGKPEHFKWMRDNLEEKYELIADAFGPDEVQQNDASSERSAAMV